MWCLCANPHTPAENNLPAHHVYFVARASLLKSPLIATRFNILDSLISHVGLGIVDEKDLKIYHVEDRPGNALVVNSLKEFISDDSFYYCIYALPLSQKEEITLKQILRQHKAVKFDKQILLKNESLYCSEFCERVLEKTNFGRFHTKPVRRVVSDPFVRSFLHRSQITYIPVDFFLFYPGIKKVESRFIPQPQPTSNR